MPVQPPVPARAATSDGLARLSVQDGLVIDTWTTHVPSSPVNPG